MPFSQEKKRVAGNVLVAIALILAVVLIVSGVWYSAKAHAAESDDLVLSCLDGPAEQMLLQETGKKSQVYEGCVRDQSRAKLVPKGLEGVSYMFGLDTIRIFDASISEGEGMGCLALIHTSSRDTIILYVLDVITDTRPFYITVGLQQAITISCLNGRLHVMAN